jgi:hypothetical protein
VGRKGEPLAPSSPPLSGTSFHVLSIINYKLSSFVTNVMNLLEFFLYSWEPKQVLFCLLIKKYCCYALIILFMYCICYFFHSLGRLSKESVHVRGSLEVFVTIFLR